MSILHFEDSEDSSKLKKMKTSRWILRHFSEQSTLLCRLHGSPAALPPVFPVRLSVASPQLSLKDPLMTSALHQGPNASAKWSSLSFSVYPPNKISGLITCPGPCAPPRVPGAPWLFTASTMCAADGCKVRAYSEVTEVNYAEFPNKII